jgi:DNA-directed RNA polymerase specialized sigma subunit
MSNEQIVEQIWNGIDVAKNQERLWLKNRKFVLPIIKRYCGFTDDLEDLEQQGL